VLRTEGQRGENLKVALAEQHHKPKHTAAKQIVSWQVEDLELDITPKEFTKIEKGRYLGPCFLLPNLLRCS